MQFPMSLFLDHIYLEPVVAVVLTRTSLSLMHKKKRNNWRISGWRTLAEQDSGVFQVRLGRGTRTLSTLHGEFSMQKIGRRLPARSGMELWTESTKELEVWWICGMCA